MSDRRNGSAPAGASRDAPAGVPARARMAAEDRRAQLVDIGVELLTVRPIHELALDEVAARAGISRSLLFHYFPTKSDYYVAVVEAAGSAMLRPPRRTDGTPRERVLSLVRGYLRLVARSYASYVALVRGASGGDPRVLQVIDDLRTALVPRWLAAADWPDDSPLTALMLRGWLVGLEEVAIVAAGSDAAAPSREQIAETMTESLFELLQVSSAVQAGPASSSVASIGRPSR